MSAANAQTAIDEILSLIDTAWTAQGSGYPLTWEDVAAPEPVVEEGKAWCRVIVRHVSSSQSTLSNVSGVRRWESIGTLICEVRSLAGKGLADARSSATLLQNALRGAKTTSGVWFRDVRQQERAVDDGWARIDVLATFEYDEVK